MGIDTFVPKVEVPVEPVSAAVLPEVVEQPVSETKVEQIATPSNIPRSGLSWLKGPVTNGLLVVFSVEGTELSTENRSLLSNMLKAIHCQPKDTGYAVIDKPDVEPDVAMDDVKGILVLGKLAGDRMVLSAGARKVPGEDYFQLNNIPLVVTLHPSEISETPVLKARAWSDLKLIAKLIAR